MRLAKKLRKNKFIYYFICLIVDIYSLFFSFLENFFLKKRTSEYHFQKTGFFKFNFEEDLTDILNLSVKSKDNEYQSTRIISQRDVKKVLTLIFNKNTREKITQITGFKYSIDHFQILENIHSLDENYKRSPHFDKSFSRNMLKIFIPINIDLQNGPLKVWEKFLFLEIKNKNKFNEYDPKLLLGQGNYIYGFNPNTCFHQLGNPDLGYQSQQIMIQLNPSLYWCFKQDLYKFQEFGESKFTSLSFLFNKTIKLI